ncbi:IS481 family transposase [Kineococcus sp. DHX-1]|uniref:IS481 family transposase n=1 Tax=Kineococcus sp. DHX-1 TaxID=3349638 RepID=UPI0036D32752
MLHRNAALVPKARLKLARLIVDEGWHERRAAERFQTSHTTARRWAARLRQLRRAGASEADLDRDGLPDAPSTPRRSPHRTSKRQVKKVLRLRRRGWGPARIGPHAGIPVSTVAKILSREGVPRLRDVDLADRQRARREVRRYERSAPGELVHMDVKKLGRIPDGGGWRVHGRDSEAGRAAKALASRRRLGYAYLHTVLDDHSRLAYTEILRDEQGPTTAAFWHRACSWFADRGVRIKRVLTDNGSNYRSRDVAAALVATGVVHKRTRPYRPQTNGKVERFHRTLITEWAYARPYASETARVRALPKFLHLYNHHRHHTALGGRPPISRVTNLRAQYN